ncbi:MAG: DUF2721 domain-containing protein [Cyanobacteria bacterium]|nr:DUF2721 domain-containing protein [Cyanobacteria bacterium bin.51]
MSPSDASAVAGLSRAIQLSVAPVFLLTGIAGLLGTFSARLGRIIDRIRIIQETIDHGSIGQAKALKSVLTVQRQRLYLINRAILFATITALLIAVVVAVLFISVVAVIDLAAVVVPIFVLSMLSLIAGLLLFLREVQLAIALNPHRY